MDREEKKGKVQRKELRHEVFSFSHPSSPYSSSVRRTEAANSSRTEPRTQRADHDPRRRRRVREGLVVVQLNVQTSADIW